ncbi:MAG: MBL fold metallo-hydrolase [Candidatus Omnitrophota bacterium]|nr:MBL fold metallo-hydrolase [Candidatus Omnitrophota bacterium]
MNIKIIAVGSSKWERFIRKWGISFLIGKDVLFDTFGSPYVFLQNIKRYNIDLSKIRHIVISHDDWDHISGLWCVIDRYKDLTVYICPNFKQDIKERIESFGAKVIEVDKPIKITDTIYATGELRSESDSRTIYEQSLVIKTIKGLAVVTGCAHPGIIAILDNINKYFNEQIYLVAGGFHLKDKPDYEINQIISVFKKRGVKKVTPIHCTGRLAIGLFRKEYGDNFIKIVPGSIIEV